MSRIRAKNTRPEMVVFRELRRRGLYFYKHYSRVPGKPDIALPRKKIAVFIDGDFWHGWKFHLKRKRLPAAYWRSKIENNIRRDRANRRMLRRLGWAVLRVWEHELEGDFEKTMKKIDVFLNLGNNEGLYAGI